MLGCSHPVLAFQHTAARRRLRALGLPIPLTKWFQHTAARRRLQTVYAGFFNLDLFQHTAARRRLLLAWITMPSVLAVSTHSRPKAAAAQPPSARAARGVSTHSRPKAAATFSEYREFSHNVSTHSRPKAAAANKLISCLPFLFQHTAARRRLHYSKNLLIFSVMFQHTAARRRLPYLILRNYIQRMVSTHSRPKAAAGYLPSCVKRDGVSTHSRPKAAASSIINPKTTPKSVSTHSRPKAAASCRITTPR